jgi:hypothetical protein
MLYFIFNYVYILKLPKLIEFVFKVKAFEKIESFGIFLCIEFNSTSLFYVPFKILSI